jgi:two-component system, chemotaxis family, sensor kinase CheA
VDNDFLTDPAMIQDFLAESEELLQRMDQDLVSLEAAPGDAELLNRIFRALHTIKGTSGFLGFEPIVRLSHRAEDVLNALRRGEVHLNQRMMDALLNVRDQLGHMLTDIRDGGLKQYPIDNLLTELELVQKSTSESLRLGEILVAQGAIASDALQGVLDTQASSPKGQKLGELLVQGGLVSAADVGNALLNQELAAKARAEASAPTMRVSVRKLDELINLIGELVLERNRLAQLSRELCAALASEELESALSQSVTRLSFITEELQGAGLNTRMVPIDAVFRRFPRLVRDVAHGLQKEVELELCGQETEIDKTMVELIGDPLVHLVRNSLDHGIELPEARTAAGKARQGKISLEARQEGDQIVISIADDGAGISSDRVLRKAIEKGLVTADRARELTSREILDFIFLPGFSTAEKVNDVSGRGVGMDVVRSNLKRLNGTIQVESVPGKGTTVRLRLPLTLAILPVLLVQVSDEAYALPLRAVIETSRVGSNDVHRVEGSEVLCLHGQTLPLLRLRKMLAVHAVDTEQPEQKAVVLLAGEKRIALLVDRLIGQESTVIKSLGAYLHQCAVAAGATIGGDGRVRLVLDPAGLLAAAEGHPRQESLQ